MSAHTLSNVIPVSTVGPAPDACRLVTSATVRALILSTGGLPSCSQRSHSRRSVPRQRVIEVCIADAVIRSRTSAVR
ncbi:hypothetical protein ACQ86B_17750 [Mycolicibacterium aichiense]|uniref:hypothetical protein n=1 Tax=Mycolicibacterium aichiense TaxID=1799 RepID=UPI003D6646A3